MRLALYSLIILLNIPNNVLAAPAAETGMANSKDKVEEISPRIEKKVPKIFSQLRSEIKKYEEDYQFRKAEEKRLKLEAYRKKLAIKNAIEREAEKDAYTETNATVHADDVIRALEKFGIPKNNINLKEQQPHNLVLRLTCENSDQAIDLSELMITNKKLMVDKDDFASVLSLTCNK